MFGWPGKFPALNRGKRGFILPLAIGAMVVLALFFGVMNLMSHGQIQGASHFLDSTRSLTIAKAGSEWALTALASGTFQSNPVIAPKAFFNTLFSDTTDPFEGELQPPIELLDYVRDQLQGTLAVRVKVFDIAPLPLLGPGFQAHPAEKSGKMEFTAIGTVGKASRKIRVTKGFKVNLIVHPVLSKFTLFVRNKLPGQQMNLLERKTAGTGFENGVPVLLNNQGDGKTISLVDLSSNRFDLTPIPPFQEIARTSGWNFFNSGGSPWIFNLCGSGANGEYDDRFLLRLGLYRNRSLESNLNMRPDSGEIIHQLREKYQGLKSDYETFEKSGNTVVKIASETLAIHYLFPGDPPRVSLVRPFGSNTKFSPTLVLGPAFTAYLILRGLDVTLNFANGSGQKRFNDVLVPAFPDKESFVTAFKPKNVLKVPIDRTSDMHYYSVLYGISDRNDAGPAWTSYSRTMSTLATGTFMDALDFLSIGQKETGTLQAPVSTAYSNPPPAIFQTIPFWNGGPETLAQARGGFGPSGKPVFFGNLADIEGCKEFQSKITAVFSSFTELAARFMHPEGLRLPGVVFVGKENLTIETPLHLLNPGILICGGNVTIKAKITSAFPFTLVSLGNILLETPAPIQAHLICLRGSFRATGGFTIKGGLAAGSLGLSEMVHPAPKSITFEPAHDPYSDPGGGIRKDLYFYQLSEQEEYFVEGGK